MSIQMVLVSSPAKPVLRSLLHQGTCCFRLCKLVGEISVHAPVRVPRFSPNCAHSRLRRSRARPFPPPPPLPPPHPPAPRPAGHARPHPGPFLSDGVCI